MFRKWFILFLLTGSFFISCKTAPAEDVSEPPTVIAGGAPREEAPAEKEIIAEKRPESESAVETTAIPAETAPPIAEEQPRPVLKLPSRSGGMKTRTPVQSESEGAIAETGEPGIILPEDNSGDTLIEPPAVITGIESMPPEIPLAADSEPVSEVVLPGESPPPGQTEIPVPEEDMPSGAAGTAGLPPSSGLPSDIETNSYNPLLPVVIVPGNTPSGMDTSQSAGPTSEKNSPASGEETTKSTDASSSETEKAAQSTGSVNSGRTSPTSKTADSQPPLLMESDIYSLTADLSGKLVIFLEGAGWIYLSSSSDGISMRDKSYDPASGRTRFVFSGTGLGQSGVEFIFLKQDLLRGESSQQSLVLDNGNNPLLSNKNTGPVPVDDSPATAAMADLNTVPSTDAEGSGIGDEQKTPEGTSPAVLTPAMTVPVPVAASEAGDFPPVGLSPSELLDLAGKFEKPGQEQSLEKAIFLYEKIRSEFPVTEERFIAEERIRYLNKHYFKVQ